MEFISEPIDVERGAFSPAAMTQGLASLPRAFAWRGRQYVILACLEHEKVSAREGHRAGNEVYLRRQQFRVELDSGQEAIIYFERQAGRGASPRSARKRWFLYSIASE